VADVDVPPAGAFCWVGAYCHISSHRDQGRLSDVHAARFLVAEGEVRQYIKLTGRGLQTVQGTLPMVGMFKCQTRPR
jgi:hypothetical protein